MADTDAEDSDEASESISYFAPAGRATAERIRKLSERALADPILQVVFEAVGGYVLVIDSHRQIIAANQALLGMLEAERGQSVLGLRPGELLNCVNAPRGPDGCGTSRQCRHCGAVAGILAAQVTDKPIDGSCAIACCVDGNTRPLEFRIRVSPLLLADERVYALVFHDITSAKRRELLDLMFIHDLGNLLTGLLGWSDELSLTCSDDAARQIVELSRRIEEQLQEQRLLLRAESGTLKLVHEPVDVEMLVASLRSWFSASQRALGRRFETVFEMHAGTLYSDSQLLLRVLGNLIKNAFEASPKDSVVTLRVIQSEGESTFLVHNVGTIATDVANQIFKRQFSTKGPARGLGIYAVQLFGEQCLGGQVSFDSTANEGTTFRLTLPNRGEPVFTS